MLDRTEFEFGNIDSIANQKDLSIFILTLLDSLRNRSDSWENITLETYLESAAAWVKDDHKNISSLDVGPDAYKAIALVFESAAIYE